MTGEESPAPHEDAAGKASPPAFDTSVAHQARVYDYLLGSKVDVLYMIARNGTL
ncbi:MAG TPA: hypothetical protein VHZ03_04350 [Trebonia sp.]|nr:hypothetical protein [Trebonia sp.]